MDFDSISFSNVFLAVIALTNLAILALLYHYSRNIRS